VGRTVICLRYLGEGDPKEYAEDYLSKERLKTRDEEKAPEDRELYEAFDRGADPVQLLTKYRFKLPFESTEFQLEIVELDRDEIANLKVFDNLIQDGYMKVPGPSSCTNRIGDLASHFLSVGYFSKPYPDPPQAQWTNYHAWVTHPGRSLVGVMAGHRPLIQCIAPDEFQIVDGWGRFLPFEALLQEGFTFGPVESFRASRK